MCSGKGGLTDKLENEAKRHRATKSMARVRDDGSFLMGQAGTANAIDRETGLFDTEVGKAVKLYMKATDPGGSIVGVVHDKRERDKTVTKVQQLGKGDPKDPPPLPDAPDIIDSTSTSSSDARRKAILAASRRLGTRGNMKSGALGTVGKRSRVGTQRTFGGV